MTRNHVACSALPSFIALASVGLLAGCPSRDVSRVDPRQATEQVKDIPINLSRDIDILFVIDNSVSMGEEQSSLRNNFPEFVRVLESIEGGLPSVHMAVVSSDVGIGANSAGSCNGSGDDGDFRQGQQDSCPEINGEFIIAGGDSTPNFTGELSDAFSCIAALGNQGCGFEAHLESMKRALTKAKDGIGPNDGFLRDDAYLAVIIIADEDDCSATENGATQLFDPQQDSENDPLGYFTSFRCWEYGVVCNDDNPGPRDMPTEPDVAARQNCVPRDAEERMGKVSDYVSYLKGLKADPSRVLVAGIIGDAEPVRVSRQRGDDNDNAAEYTLLPSCESASGEAAPATRLKAFLDAFPNRNVQQTICEPDLTGALQQIAELLARVVGTPCLEGNLIDTDPSTEVVEPDCRVTDYQFKGSSREESNSMPSCDLAGDARPCYRIIDGADLDPAQCGETPTGLALQVCRDAGCTPGAESPPETTVGIRCAAE